MKPRASEPVILAIALSLAVTACTSTPTPSPSVAPAPNATASPAPTPGATAVASGSPAASASFGLSSSGAVDSAGTFGRGGLWAIRGTTLFISTDGGVTWHGRSIPAANTSLIPGDTIVVLDRLHIWSIGIGPGSTGSSGSSSDVTHYVVSRSIDGGATWRPSSIAGNQAGTSPSIQFIDAQHGYLLAAADRHSLGTSTVLRTDDGGATWSVAGTSSWLGSLLAVSDAATVWAGGEEQAGGQFEQPVLGVSRDAGRTWRAVALPEISGTTEAQCGCYLAEPPLFLDASTGFITVVSSFGNGQSYTRVDRTTDGGHTWSQVADRPDVDATGLALLDTTDWLMPTINPTEVDGSADGGASWTAQSSGGIWDQTFGLWIGALGSTQVAALVAVPNAPDPGLSALLLTTDGGREWHQIDVR
jgi:photosystem II stability/assembly factor-like uncharacterized protein